MDYFRRKMNYTRTALAAAMFATAVFASCSDENGRAAHQTVADPAVVYRAYLLDIRSRTALSTQELVSELGRWQALDDSVALHLQRDTLPYHSDARCECDLLHDSVRTEFCRLALSHPRTYGDLLYLKECLSPYCHDGELLLSADETAPFFESVSRQPPFAGNCRQTVRAYRDMLRQTLGRRIHSTDDLMLFIRREDAFFRAFLTHLNQLGRMNVSDITRDTERCCMEVFHAAERNEISYKEAMICLAMRTNRRLLLNLRQCTDDIRTGKVRTAEQAQAYIWMLLQPYTSLDAFCIALLTPQERETLHQAAADTAGLIERLGNALSPDNGPFGDIPSLLVQAYISQRCKRNEQPI